MLPALLLYAGSISWVIGYDTIYAHQDREDDALIGVKSTALLFGERTKPMLAAFYAAAVVLIGLAGMDRRRRHRLRARASSPLPRISPGRSRGSTSTIRTLCLRLFKSNRDAGLILFAALVLDAARRSVVLSANLTPRDDFALAAMHGGIAGSRAGAPQGCGRRR